MPAPFQGLREFAAKPSASKQAAAPGPGTAPNLCHPGVLTEEKRLNTPAGRPSFAILLFQDLAVVPVLLVLGALGPSQPRWQCHRPRPGGQPSAAGERCDSCSRPSGAMPAVRL